jgi:steroid delta-isomerase-like uncharacterized protein
MDPTDIVMAWLDMCRTGDEMRFAELAADDFVLHGPDGSGDRGDFLAWLCWYPTAFTERESVIDDVIASGDRVVVRYTVRSTYRGGYLDLPANGQTVRETGIIIYRLANGKVAETWFEGNDLELARQLGARITAGAAAVPPPDSPGSP